MQNEPQRPSLRERPAPLTKMLPPKAAQYPALDRGRRRGTLDPGRGRRNRLFWPVGNLVCLNGNGLGLRPCSARRAHNRQDDANRV